MSNNFKKIAKLKKGSNIYSKLAVCGKINENLSLTYSNF